MPRTSARKGKKGHQQVGSITGIKREAWPDFIEPCHPTLESTPPHGEQWIHEIKLDGYRVQAHVREAAVTIYTRGGLDWTNKFESIAASLRSLRHECVIDGEIVALDDEGLPNFHFLQRGLGKVMSDRLVLYAFDLLHLDGFDVRAATLMDRRRLLKEVCNDVQSTTLRISEAFTADGQAVFASVKNMGLEGVVSKRKDSPYRSGRQKLWIKAKAMQSDTYIVVGFTAQRAFRPHRVDGLYFAQRENDRLVYAGKAETGFPDRVAIELYARLAPIVRKTSPLSVAVRKPKATWVEPELQVEIEFTGITSDGYLRHPRFRGIREDLEP